MIRNVIRSSVDFNNFHYNLLMIDSPLVVKLLI